MRGLVYGPTRNRTENLLIKSNLAGRDQQTLAGTTKHESLGWEPVSTAYFPLDDEMTERLQGRYVDHIFATYGPMGARCFGIGRIRMRGPYSANVAQDRAALSRQT